MKNLIVSRPEPDEYAEYYHGYVLQIENDDILSVLNEQTAETEKILFGISEEKGGFRYAEGKWSIKELIGHLIDAERIFAYRVLRISRGDKTPIEGFDQDSYIENFNYDNCRIIDLAEELLLVRKANIKMFQICRRRLGIIAALPIIAKSASGHRLI